MTTLFFIAVVMPRLMNLQQAVDAIQEMESDTEIDIVELPPDRVDQLTDEEEIG